MAATAGTLTFLTNSGKTISVDAYIPDATGTQLTFNPAGLAASTSPASFRLPEDATLIDVSIGTAPTAVGTVIQADTAPVIGGALRWANQLQTLANRQKLAIKLRAGAFVSAIQF
jgi:hypothetical protein